jgi:hypothetical protein
LMVPLRRRTMGLVESCGSVGCEKKEIKRRCLKF